MGYVMGYVPRFLMGDLHALTDGRDPDEYLFANSKGGRIGISSWKMALVLFSWVVARC